MIKIFKLIVLFLILISCSSQKRFINEAKEEGIILQDLHSSKLSGQYSFMSESGNEGLFYFLSENDSVDLTTIDSNLQIVCDIKHDSLNFYTITIQKQDSLISSDTLNLEIETNQNVFKLKTRFTFEIYGIVNFVWSVERFIGIDQNDNLVTYKQYSGWAFLLFAPAFASSQTYISTFQRK